MKKKIIPFVALAALISMSACTLNNTSRQSSTSEPTSSTVTPSVSVSSTSSSEVSSSTNTTINVTGIELALEKTNLFVGETTTATVTITPSDATDATYSLVSGNTEVATVLGNTITAVGAGSTKIIATSNDGKKVSEVNLIVEDIPAPTLNIPGEKTLTVKAGESINLPAVTATDYLGNDLSQNIEVEDTAENGTINNGVFTAKIAGTHTIAYYVEDEDGRYAEDEILINVEAATPESFDVEGYQDLSAMKNYGVFKENFSKGKKSPLAAITDSQNATYITGTSEAISGNSLVMDMNKTAGSSANSIFLNAFNDYFHRDVQATYKVSFKYKLLTPANNYGDVYFGLSWDDSNGLNNKFVTSGAVQDQVYEFSTSFLATSIPSAKNAYFFFFKLSGSTEDIKIAVDDFVIETVECAQVVPVEPSATELEAGFTWDFKDNGATVSNGETVIVKNIENEATRTALTDSEYFSDNSLKLINADDHLFSGLTKNNMTPEKKLSLEMVYYAPSAEAQSGFHLIMMGENGNPTLSIENQDLGNGFHKVTYSGLVANGYYKLNIYAAGNPNFEIYIGYLTATLSEPDPIPAGTTTNGYKEGDSWSWTSRQWGNQDKGAIKTEAFDDNAAAIENEKMGTVPTKFTVSGANVNMEWAQAGGKIETGHVYEIKVTYYVESFTEGARLMINFDNNVFLELPSSVGFHEETITWTATKDVDFMSIYCPDQTEAVFYLASFDVTLKTVVQ